MIGRIFKFCGQDIDLIGKFFKKSSSILSPLMLLKQTLSDILDISGQSILIFEFEVFDIIGYLTRRMLNDKQILIKFVICDSPDMFTIASVLLELPYDIFIF